MSSSTWRVLSGYATYQRTPIRMTSGGKCAPLKLIAIVVLPHDVALVMEGDHTANGRKGKLATKPLRALGLPLKTNGVSRLQTNKHNSTYWLYCHDHVLPPRWSKACNPARDGGAHGHHRFDHGLIL